MAPKTFCLLGGTGSTGLIFIEKAVANGHHVRVFARTPSKIPEKLHNHDQVTIIEGYLWDEDLLSTAIKGTDAVVSILGPSSLRITPGTFVTPYKLIMKFMREHGVKRIFVMGTLSITDPKDKPSFLVRAMVFFIWLFGRPTWTEIINIGKTFDEDAKDLDWTIYRLGLVTNGPDGEVATTYAGESDFVSFVYRNELAGWLLEQAEKTVPEFVHEKPAVCSAGKKKV
ncbi:NAD(P)-binding protein [Lophium mytilinum]|uniref:NAD(P)-binding protein n=1 Tax=Lophium mytilinum TaxID=390894 RepID=A0A6A6RAS8_9PEZI|nr:NAD(P)-binding protein [Lophium mytilinum]